MLSREDRSYPRTLHKAEQPDRLGHHTQTLSPEQWQTKAQQWSENLDGYETTD